MKKLNIPQAFKQLWVEFYFLEYNAWMQYSQRARKFNNINTVSKWGRNALNDSFYDHKYSEVGIFWKTKLKYTFKRLYTVWARFAQFHW